MDEFVLYGEEEPVYVLKGSTITLEFPDNFPDDDFAVQSFNSNSQFLQNLDANYDAFEADSYNGLYIVPCLTPEGDHDFKRSSLMHGGGTAYQNCTGERNLFLFLVHCCRKRNFMSNSKNDYTS